MLKSKDLATFSLRELSNKDIEKGGICRTEFPAYYVKYVKLGCKAYSVIVQTHQINGGKMLYVNRRIEFSRPTLLLEPLKECVRRHVGILLFAILHCE